MSLKLWILTVFVGQIVCYESILRFGLIQRKGEEIEEELFRRVLKKELQSGRQYVSFQTITELVPKEDAWFYHRAMCRLLEQGVQVIVAPTSTSTFPLLSSYSNQYKFPFLSPELPEAPEDPTAPDLIAKYGFGIRPSTTRATLDLIRYYGWQNLVYIYEDDFAPEKLQIMFRVAYSVLKLNLIGYLKTTSPEDTVQYLRKLDTSSSNLIPVILDVDVSLATEILLRFVHDAGLRKHRYQFLLIQPTLEDFWTLHEAEFRVLNVTGFLVVEPDFKRFSMIEEEWRKLYNYEAPYPNSSLKLSYYYYHDAALVLSKAMKTLPVITDPRYQILTQKFPGCFHESNTDLNFGYPQHIKRLKEVIVEDGLTGRIEFEKWNETQSKRKNFKLTIIQSSSSGYQKLGTWSMVQHGLQLEQKPVNDQPLTLPQIDQKLRVTARLSPPFLMLKKGDNASSLKGNDRYEGYCKDILDQICWHLRMACEIKLVEDGLYGMFDPVKGRWTGMIGELIQGKADLAIGDLFIRGDRQRVVEFTDPFEMVSFSLLMKNPDMVGSGSSSIFFIFSAFSVGVWICIVVAFVLFCALFHGISMYTGAPDSIESASGIWGRKNRIVVNMWFSVGSTLMQGTGIYPRSISSRILSGSWWFFTAVMACTLIASLTFLLQNNNTQEGNSLPLTQLKAMSVESIIRESLENGWPKVGVVYPGSTARFIKASSLPLYKKYADFIDNYPSALVSNIAEGAARVRSSAGGYFLLAESIKSEYESRQSPCDLVTVQDSFVYGAYGIALPLKSPLRQEINEALTHITAQGLLGHLHRKWWVESSQCKNKEIKADSQGVLRSFSGLFYIAIIGFLILVAVFIAQYFRKIQRKEDRLQQLTFDDRTLEHHLPDPPPELLENPPPVLNVPEIEKKDFCDSENFSDFIDRMRAGR